MTDTPTSPGPPPTVWTALKVADASALIDYLTDVFGFVVAARYGEGERVDHCELIWPEGSGGVMLGSARPGCETPLTGPSTCYVVVADPDALHARVIARGAQVTSAIADTPYGSREFAIRDPAGNVWSFGDYPGALSDPA